MGLEIVRRGGELCLEIVGELIWILTLDQLLPCLDKLLSTLDKLLAVVDKLSNGPIISNCKQILIKLKNIFKTLRLTKLICKLLSTGRHLIGKLLDKLIWIIGKLLKVLLSELSDLTRIGAKVVINSVAHCFTGCSHELTDHFLKHIVIGFSTIFTKFKSPF